MTTNAELKKELDESINYCIEALNDGKNEDSQAQLSSKVWDTISKFKILPYQGRNLGIADLNFNGDRSTFAEYLERINNPLSHCLDWLKAILVLYDFANYNEQEILESAQKVNDDIIFNHIMKHIITNFTQVDDIGSAIKYIPYFRPTHIFKESDNQDQGYLMILRYYASKGDIENFFKYFKKSKPAITRTEIDKLKTRLVSVYTTSHGIHEAIKLCSHKNLGSNYYYAALDPFIKDGKYNELKQTFELYPELKQPEKETELLALTEAYQQGHKAGLEVDDDFDYLFERAKQVDRKLRWGDFKLQDAILLNLGLAHVWDNKERMLRSRKAIKDNSLKKELIYKGT